MEDYGKLFHDEFARLQLAMKEFRAELELFTVQAQLIVDSLMKEEPLSVDTPSEETNTPSLD